MDYLNKNISINLKSIRREKGMSMDEVSEQTGVSKSMLGQIERGEANPTIGTLGKIVSGLRVDLQDLTRAPGIGVYEVNREKLIPTKEVPGRYAVYTYFPYEKNRLFEIYEIEIEPGACYVSGAHGQGTNEYIVVHDGELTLEIEKSFYHVKREDAICFETAVAHTYWNKGQNKLKFITVFMFKM
ncbi:helix-turn-helix domain-containing protein [Acetobacterium bakii]|uniref:DNA-binding protein n=1 Tax=Acetobacterium bakii TaxID=52689 RepID=A0A0L6TVA3_9FIRM|nr:XRE family transcriptional regulator [Acetobacterium bakii]KNZ40193.1 DNA-binding protein [Acetobacterium bakii]